MKQPMREYMQDYRDRREPKRVLAAYSYQASRAK